MGCVAHQERVQIDNQKVKDHVNEEVVEAFVVGHGVGDDARVGGVLEQFPEEELAKGLFDGPGCGFNKLVVPYQILEHLHHFQVVFLVLQFEVSTCLANSILFVLLPQVVVTFDGVIEPNLVLVLAVPVPLQMLHNIERMCVAPLNHRRVQ